MDFVKVFDYIEALLEMKIDPCEKIAKLIDLCEQESPSSRWTELRAIDWSTGFDELYHYVRESLMHLPDDIIALYFGIANYVDDDIGFTDFYIAGSETYTDDGDYLTWAVELDWDMPISENSAMKRMYKTAHRAGDEALGNDAEYPLALSFVNFGVKAILSDIPLTIKGVVAGFHDGDYIFLKK